MVPTLPTFTSPHPLRTLPPFILLSPYYHPTITLSPPINHPFIPYPPHSIIFSPPFHPPSTTLSLPSLLLFPSLSTLLPGDARPSDLSHAQVAALSQTIRDEKQIKPPSALCLSPAGTYMYLHSTYMYLHSTYMYLHSTYMHLYGTFMYLNSTLVLTLISLDPFHTPLSSFLILSLCSCCCYVTVVDVVVLVVLVLVVLVVA